MARPDATKAFAKWSQRVAASQPYYQAGIANSKDWAQAALAAAPARDAGLQQAIADGRIDRGIQRLGTGTWRSRTLAKGPANWSAAVQSPDVQTRFMAGYGRLMQQLDAGDQAVSNLPRGGFAQNLQRMTAYATAVHNAAEQQKQQG